MLNNLTGLRFYAAMWVFLYHFFPVYTTAPKIDFFEIGFLGVDVFFVLSGFILTYVYYQKFFINTVSGSDFRTFVVKRFAKIYPLHFLLTIVFIPLLYCGKYIFKQDSINIYLDTLLQNFLLIHAWATTDHYSWNSLSWSISAEWFAYLFLFAPLAVVYKKSKLFFIVLSLLIIFGFIFYWGSLRDFTLHRYTMNGLPRIIPEFILGVLAGLIKIKFDLNKRQASMVLLIGLLFLVSAYYFGFYFHQLCILGFAGIILSLSYPTYVDSMFGSKILIYLGNISYAFYLTQFLSLIIYEQIFRIIFGGAQSDYLIVIQFLMAFFINFAFAAIAYKYFEEPIRLFLVTKMIRSNKGNAIAYTN